MGPGRDMRASGAGDRATWRQCCEGKEAGVEFCFPPHLRERVIIIHRFQDMSTVSALSTDADPSPQRRWIKKPGAKCYSVIADERHGVAQMYQLGRATG